MDQTEVFTLQELAKIKAIKQEKGIQSDAELIRFLLNEMEKKFLPQMFIPKQTR